MTHLSLFMNGVHTWHNAYCDVWKQYWLNRDESLADRKKRNKRRCKQQERFNAFTKSQPQINPTSNIETTFHLFIHIHVYDIRKIILFTINDI